MSLLHFSTCGSLYRPISATKKPIISSTPARDMVIDFGKYRGRMMGTLPSNYLRWVSKNLRARDFEDWAKKADEVLSDPVYSDRLEWEFADKILNGNDSRVSRTESPVSDLLEISKRFGWDNEDQCGWSRVDFDLLGTSMGARIPRVKDKLEGKKSLGFGFSERDQSLGSSGRVSRFKCEKKVGFLSGDFGFSERDQSLGSSGRVSRFKCEKKVSEISEGGEVRGRRETRRERQRLKREVGVGGLEMEKLREEEKEDGLLLLEGGNKRVSGIGKLNPFPGRGALLRKLNKA